MQYDFKYDPKRMMPIPSHNDWITHTHLSTLCCEAAVSTVMDSVHKHI